MPADQNVDLNKFTVNTLITFLIHVKSSYPKTFKYKLTPYTLTPDDLAKLGSVSRRDIIEAISRRFTMPTNIFGSRLTTFFSQAAKVVVKGDMLQVTAQEITIDVELVGGIPCPSGKTAKQLELYFPNNKIEPTVPQIITLSSQIADMLHLVNGSWRAKAYTDDFCSLVGVYSRTSALLEATMSQVSKDATMPSKKGSELVDYLIHNLSFFAKSNPDGFLGLYNILAKDLLPVIKAVGLPQMRTKIGDFPQDSIQFAKFVLEKCRGIRGGDDSDTSVRNTAYYLDVTVPRNVAKALVFTHDYAFLRGATGIIPLKLSGKDSSTYFAYLVTVNVLTGYLIYEGKLTADWVINNDGAFARLNTSFVVVRKPPPNTKFIHICCDFLEDSRDLDHRRDENVFYTCVLSPDFSYNNFYPSTLVHSLSGFYNPVLPLQKEYVIPQKKYLALTVAVNLSRTFYTACNMPFRKMLQTLKINNTLAVPDSCLTGFMKSAKYVTAEYLQEFDLEEILVEKMDASVLRNLRDEYDDNVPPPGDGPPDQDEYQTGDVPEDAEVASEIPLMNLENLL